jgi:magnesium-protoporphyrin O-methyltransferase
MALSTLCDDGVTDRSVLEVGGGVGSLQIELLKAGASHSTNVEIIDSYERTARLLIAEHRFEDRIERQIADYAQRQDQTPAVDILIMHRVICCYADPGSLTSAACSGARDRVAITIPREAWWVRLAFHGMNGWLRLRRIAFRGYVHPHALILAVASSQGFHPNARHERGLLWESFILERASSTGDGGAF